MTEHPRRDSRTICRSLFLALAFIFGPYIQGLSLAKPSSSFLFLFLSCRMRTPFWIPSWTMLLASRLWWCLMCRVLLQALPRRLWRLVWWGFERVAFKVRDRVGKCIRSFLWMVLIVLSVLVLSGREEARFALSRIVGSAPMVTRRFRSRASWKHAISFVEEVKGVV